MALTFVPVLYICYNIHHITIKYFSSMSMDGIMGWDHTTYNVKSNNLVRKQAFQTIPSTPLNTFYSMDLKTKAFKWSIWKPREILQNRVYGGFMLEYLLPFAYIVG